MQHINSLLVVLTWHYAVTNTKKEITLYMLLAGVFGFARFNLIFSRKETMYFHRIGIID